MSSDGRFVAFASDATNLVPGDTNKAADVFLRDRRTGMTSRVSVSTGDKQANGGSYFASMSGDGRFVTFSSDATNLVPGDTNGRTDIFIRDRVAGLTRRVSVSTTNVQGDGSSTSARVTADGRYVVFASLAKNLGSGDPFSTGIFVRDRLAATTSQLPYGFAGFDILQPHSPAISASGRWVVYSQCCANLEDPGVQHPNEPPPDVMVTILYDSLTGVSKVIAPVGGQTFGTTDGGVGGISADGRYVAYTCCGNLAYIYDRVTGATTRVGSRHSVNAVAISGDGRFVASSSPALVQPNFAEVFVWDRTTGITSLVSVHPDNAHPDGSSGGPAVDVDGARIAFQSLATDLVPGDTNGTTDVFVRGTR